MHFSKKGKREGRNARDGIFFHVGYYGDYAIRKP